MSSSYPSTKSQDIDRIHWLYKQRTGHKKTVEDSAAAANQDRCKLTAGISSKTLAQRIDNIVQRNLSSGRAGRVMMGQATENLAQGMLEAYAERVTDHYLQEHVRVEALAARDGEEWHRLYEQLARSAWRTLQRYEVSSARAADEAQDLAQETCEAIFAHPFPYDVPFDAWVGRILLNRILYRRIRSRELLDRDPDVKSLDEAKYGRDNNDLSLYDLLADGDWDTTIEQIETREWLVQMIAGLRSQYQQQVLIDEYFHDLDIRQIAIRMGKTRQAVWNLHGRAIRNLRAVAVQPSSARI